MIVISLLGQKKLQVSENQRVAATTKGVLQTKPAFLDNAQNIPLRSSPVPPLANQLDLYVPNKTANLIKNLIKMDIVKIAHRVY